MSATHRLRPTLFLALCLGTLARADEARVIDVYHDPQCGCCTEWVRHLKANGFTIKDHPQADMAPVKKKLGVPARLNSCHTGVYQGKFVEGHVPAAQVLELGKRKNLVGAAVPGMPMGSPGMEMGEHRQAYEVIGVRGDGRESVMANYPAQPASEAGTGTDTK